MDHRIPPFGKFIYEKTESEIEQKISTTSLKDAQYAVMYLIFRGKTGALQQPYRSMDEKNLRIMAGLSDQTLRHRKREMSILSGVETVAHKGDEYYENLLAKLQDREDLTVADLQRTARLYLTFNEMPIEQVAEIAMDAFTEENKERGEHYHYKNQAAQSKYAQDRKVKDSIDRKRIQSFVSDYTKAYSQKMPFAEARLTAIKMAVQKFAKTDAEIRKIVEGK